MGSTNMDQTKATSLCFICVCICNCLEYVEFKIINKSLFPFPRQLETMSATSESLRPILLRSSTPGQYCMELCVCSSLIHSHSTEREGSVVTFYHSYCPHTCTVLLYLEGLRESQNYGSPVSSPLPPLTSPFEKRRVLGIEDEIEEIHSNIQDGRKTELSVDHRSEMVIHFPFSLPVIKALPIARTWTTGSSWPSIRVFRFWPLLWKFRSFAR